MAGGTNIGTMFAEIDLDRSKYDAGLERALGDSKSVSIDIEKAWRTMGTRSAKDIDKMRANIVNSYELIKHSALSTQDDITRAEVQAKAKLERINNTYYKEQIKQAEKLEAETKRALKATEREAERVHKEQMNRSRELEAELRRANEATSAGFAKAGKAALAFGAVVATASLMIAKSVIEQGMAFETTMKTVQAISSGSAKTVEELTDNLNKLTEAARKSGATTEWSAQQSGEALKFMAMTGMSVNDQIRALPGLLDLATAAQMELGMAADIVTDSLTAFGMATSEIGRFNDALINTTIRANTTVEMLGESLKYVAPVAANMGYSIEKTAGLLGILANSGIKAEQAGTSLRQALIRTGKAAKSMGMDINSSLIDVLTEMKNRQFSVNEVVEEYGLIASTGAVIMMNNIDKYKELTHELENNEGATKSLADMIRDTLKVDVDLLKSSIHNLALELYKQYGDKLKNLVKGVTEFIGDNKDEFIALGQAVGGVIEVMLKFMTTSVKMAKMAIFGRENDQYDTNAAWDVSIKKVEKYVSTLYKILPAIENAYEIDYGNPMDGYSDIKAEADLKALANLKLAAEEAAAKMKALGEAWSKGAVSKESYDFQLKALKDAEAASIESYGNQKVFHAVYLSEKAKLDKEYYGTASKTAGKSAEDKLRIHEKFEDDYSKATTSSFEYQKSKLDEHLESLKVNGEDKLKIQEWYDAQLKVLTDKETARKDKIAKKEFDDFFKGMEDMADATLDAYEDRIEAEEKALKEQQKLREEAYDDFSDTITGFTADIITDWEDGWDSMFDTMKAALVKMAAEAIATNIIVPVGMYISGAMGMSWGGQAMSSMTGGSATGSGGGSMLSSGASIAQNASSLWGAYSGSMATTVETAMTTGIGASVTGAGAAGIEAGGVTLGSAGIASSFATAVPYVAAAIAVVAIADSIFGLFGDDPNPLIKMGSSTAGYKSDFGYGVNPDDMGDQEPVAKATITYFDTYFAALDDEMSINLKNVLQNSDYRTVADMSDFNGDITKAFVAMSDDIFRDIEPALVEAMGLSSDTFDLDFFEEIQVEGLDLFNTFIGFEKLAESFTDFEGRINEQLTSGTSLSQAYENLTVISSILEMATTSIEAMASSSTITTLENITDNYTAYITAMEAAGATQEELAELQVALTQEIGSAITGLSANTIQSGIISSVSSGTSLSDAMTAAVNASLAQTIAGVASENIMEDYVTGLNQQVGEAVSASMIDGTLDTDLLVSSVTGAMDSFDWDGMEASVKTAVDAVNALTGANEEAAKSIEQVVNLSSEWARLNIELLTAQGDSVGALAAQRKIELAAIDETLRPTQELIWAYNDASTAADIATSAQNDLSSAISATVSAKSAYISALQSELDTLENNLTEQKDNYVSLLEDELTILEDNLNDAKSVYIDLLNDEMSAQKDVASSLESTIDSLISFRENLFATNTSVALSRDYALSNVYSTASQAQAGDLDAFSDLSGYLSDFVDASKASSGSYEEYRKDVSLAARISAEMEGVAGSQLTDAEVQVNLLQSIVDGIEGTTTAVWSVSTDIHGVALGVEDVSENVQGVSSDVVTMDQARANYEAAKATLDVSDYASQVELLSGANQLTSDIAQAEADYQSAKTDLETSWQQAEIDGLTGIESGIFDLKMAYLDAATAQAAAAEQAATAATAAAATAQAQADAQAAYAAAQAQATADLAAAQAIAAAQAEAQAVAQAAAQAAAAATAAAQAATEQAAAQAQAAAAQAAETGYSVTLWDLGIFASWDGVISWDGVPWNNGGFYADGGIATGPTSGYPATLHGTEAVIPLASGNIPVQITSPFNSADNYNNPLIDEIKSLKKVISDMKIDNEVQRKSIAKSNLKIEKYTSIFEDWDVNGIPAERVA